MFKKLSKAFLILTFICLGFFSMRIAPIFIGAHANEQTVIINEIAWMGTVNNTYDEWIELRNLSGREIDLTGWQLLDADGDIKVVFGGEDKRKITNKKIPANGFYLLERTDDDSVPGITADFVYTGNLSNNSNTKLEGLRLLDEQRNLVDEVLANSGSDNKQWPAGDNASKKTMERKNDGGWQTSQNVGGTPRAANSAGSQPAAPVCGNNILETGEQCDDGNLTNGDGCSSSCQTETIATTTPSENGQPSLPPTQGEGVKYKLGDAVINEFVSDPSDDDVEWIEIYNTTSKEIDLNGWSVEEGSIAKTSLSGKLGISGNNRFFVVEKPKGNLNNAGDIIILRDSQGNLIDQVSYGNWDDGNKENNAPVATDPGSVARIFDGQNSFNNANDFTVTTRPTKGLSNIIEGESEIAPENKANYDYSNDIFINEIFSNPIGPDNPSTGSGQGEFIEVFNNSTREVNLAGWSLSDAEDKKVKIEAIATSTIIKAGGYLVIFRSKSKIVLNNDKDSVKLFQPLVEKAYQNVKYSKAVEGWSYNNANFASLNANIANNANMRMDDNWIWSEVVTPGKANVIKTINRPPVVNFNFPEEIIVGVPVSFDSSDTYDENGDELKYSWDFGDGIKNNLACPEHTFLKVGTYTVKLTVNDGKNEIKKEEIVKVGVTPHLQPLSRSYLTGEGSKGDEGEVIINEILPNPAGSDTSGEWLELKSNKEEKVNLINWKIESNKDNYEFKKDIWLAPQGFYLLQREESKLVLNNELGDISLFNNLSELADKVEYRAAVEGESYARGENGKWFWTTVLTPGKENVISVAGSSEGSMNYELGIMENGEVFVETTLDKVSQFEVGDLVKVKGIVAVEPGILGTQIFYIVSPRLRPSGFGGQASPSPSLASADAKASKQERGSEEGVVMAGLQIYNYKKDFPSLKVGDLIEVAGELSQVSGEMRLKTKSKEDMKVVEHGAPPAPIELSCGSINEENVGQLLSVTGEITERKSNNVYLDDGSDELIVYLKSSTNIQPKNFIEGSNMNVVGILGMTKTGVRLMPRSMEDIIINAAEAAEPQVLGEVTSSNEWEIESRNKKMELFKYLLIIAGGVIVVLAGVLVKYRKK